MVAHLSHALSEDADAAEHMDVLEVLHDFVAEGDSIGVMQRHVEERRKGVFRFTRRYRRHDLV